MASILCLTTKLFFFQPPMAHFHRRATNAPMARLIPSQTLQQCSCLVLMAHWNDLGQYFQQNHWIPCKIVGLNRENYKPVKTLLQATFFPKSPAVIQQETLVTRLLSLTAVRLLLWFLTHMSAMIMFITSEQSPSTVNTFSMLLSSSI